MEEDMTTTWSDEAKSQAERTAEFKSGGLVLQRKYLKNC